MLRLSIRASLKAKLVALVALLLLGISWFISIYFPRRMLHLIVRSTEADARNLATMAAFNVAPALFFGDRASALEALRGSEEAENVAYLVVLDVEGRIFAAIGQEVAERAGYEEPVVLEPDSTAADIYRTIAPVVHDGRPIGTLHQGISLAPMRAEIARMRGAIALVSAAVFVVGLAATVGIGAYLTRPLRAIMLAVEEIRAGRWSRRARVASRDEVGELAAAFNHMLDDLDAARRELERLNRNLERRVADRTAELECEVEERRSSEEALRRSNERFLRAAATIEGVVYEWDIVDNRVEWTDGLQRTFGYDSLEGRTTVDWWSERVHPADLEQVLARREADLRAGRDFEAKYRFRNGSGEFLHVFDRGSLGVDEQGRPRRMVGVMENITELHRLEEQLRQAQKMEAVGRLAGGVAHDFNNMLTGIIGYAELLLLKMPADDPHRKEVEEILAGGQRAAALTRQLLAFSRKQVVEPRVFDLNAVLLDMEKMLRRLIGEDVALETELAADAGRVRMDPGQLEQVVLNIAVNARDAMPRGGRLAVRTASRRRDAAAGPSELTLPPGPYVLLEVQDSGCGMDEATRARIFEPFFTTKDVGKGTGLGMATVYGIVKQAGGDVTVESAPDQGTTIRILLPQVGDLEQAARREEPAVARGGNGERVLLVEDEDSVRGLVRGTLQANGYAVLEARDARQALDVASRETTPIDLLLTDVVMPRMSGPELADRLRAERPGLRVAFMSGYTNDMIVGHGVSASEVRLLQKPFTVTSLLRHVREALGSARRAAA